MKKRNQYLMCTLGALLFAGAINIFIVPMGLYNGGFVGISQLIRTIMERYFGIVITSFDVSGVLYFLLNVPLLWLAYKEMSRSFLYKTAYTVALQTVLLTIIPIPSTPLITDMLTACILGGIIAGTGAGLVLRAGSSGGGQDILGVYFSKRRPDFTVGKLSIMINIGVYAVCALMFNGTVVIYSLIYTFISSMMVDKVHTQNISSTITIFSKKDNIQKELMQKANRGVTYWKGVGAYTDETTNVLVIVSSKYEINKMKQIIRELDPNAFIIVNEGTRIYGNFEKRLEP